MFDSVLNGIQRAARFCRDTAASGWAGFKKFVSDPRTKAFLSGLALALLIVFLSSSLTADGEEAHVGHANTNAADTGTHNESFESLIKHFDAMVFAEAEYHHLCDDDDQDAFHWFPDDDDDDHFIYQN